MKRCPGTFVSEIYVVTYIPFYFEVIFMSRKSWLQGLVQLISMPSQRRFRKGPAFSPVRIEILEERSTPATLDWTGAVSTKWNNPGNWSQNQVPSAANNTLNFGGAVAVTNYTSDNDI